MTTPHSTRNIAPSPISNSRNGSVLLIVLVVTAMLALGAASYLALMQSELEAVRFHGRRAQVDRLAESGAQYARLLLSLPLAEIQKRGGWLNNPAELQAVLVDEPADELGSGRFTIMAPSQSSGYYSGVRCGLEDESAKLNLNILLAPGAEEFAQSRLSAIPGMTPDLADAILDWLDADDSPRPYGAERDYYSQLAAPYAPRNGPLADLDELLQVRGMTPEVLYGLDWNRNLLVESAETPRGMLLQLDNSDGVLDRGWSAYMTVHSLEGPRAANGSLKLDINGNNLQELYNQLKNIVTEPEAKFIIAYRQQGGDQNQNPGNGNGQGGGDRGGNGNTAAASRADGQSSSSRQSNNASVVAAQAGPGGQPGQPGQQPTTVSAEALQLDFSRQGTTRINSLLELVDARARVPAAANSSPQVVESPWKQDTASYRKLLSLQDAVSTAGSARIAGRVNVNAASRPVLASIPNIPPAAVDQIISRRQWEPDWVAGDQRSSLWLLVDGIVTFDQMRQLEPYITSRGDVFSGQVYGYFDAGGPASRFEMIVDRSAVTPRLRAWHELTNLGPGLPRSTIGASDSQGQVDDNSSAGQ